MIELMEPVAVILTPAPEGGYTALDPETGTVSESDTVEQACANLQEAVSLYLETFPRGPIAERLVPPSG